MTTIRIRQKCWQDTISKDKYLNNFPFFIYMNKEDIHALAQLLTSMKNATNEVENAVKNNNKPQLEAAKKRILSLQTQINQKI